jgi:hypothetical protein
MINDVMKLETIDTSDHAAGPASRCVFEDQLSSVATVPAGGTLASSV